MKNNKKELILFIVLIILFCMSIAPKTFQNDTFFTIAIGENILKNGIDNKEVLVWHDNLEFTNVRWLFNVIIALIYNAFDFFGIYFFVILMSVIIGVTLFYILIQNKINIKLSFLMTIVIMWLGQEILAARAQIISILLFLIEFFCIEKFLDTNRKKYGIYLIILSILISNIHTSLYPLYFIFFIPYFAEDILARIFKKSENEKLIIKKRENIKSLLVVFVVSIFTGLCTPLGLAPYTVMVKASSGLSTQIILELQPLVCINNIGFVAYIIVLFGILIFSNVKIRCSDAFLIVGLILMSISTIRSIFYLFFIGGIVLVKIINEFLLTNKFYEYKNHLLTNIMVIIVSVLIISYSCNEISKRLLNEYVDLTKYPVEACEYIKENLNTEKIRIYNGFNIGSYLEFKGIPAFMDSRSEVYCPEFNDTSILYDYVNINTGIVHYNDVFNKYEITHVLIKNNEFLNVYMQKDSNWNNIYQDDCFTIYERIY